MSKTVFSGVKPVKTRQVSLSTHVTATLYWSFLRLHEAFVLHVKQKLSPWPIYHGIDRGQRLDCLALVGRVGGITE